MIRESLLMWSTQEDNERKPTLSLWIMLLKCIIFPIMHKAVAFLWNFNHHPFHPLSGKDLRFPRCRMSGGSSSAKTTFATMNKFAGRPPSLAALLRLRALMAEIISLLFRGAVLQLLGIMDKESSVNVPHRTIGNLAYMRIPS